MMEDGPGGFADVDDDGAMDVVVTNPYANVAGRTATGAILWFRGPIQSTPVTPILFSAPMFEDYALLGQSY
jgi:hypothetical protein